jgi:hypothetical protein
MFLIAKSDMTQIVIQILAKLRIALSRNRAIPIDRFGTANLFPGPRIMQNQFCDGLLFEGESMKLLLEVESLKLLRQPIKHGFSPFSYATGPLGEAWPEPLLRLIGRHVA